MSKLDIANIIINSIGGLCAFQLLRNLPKPEKYMFNIDKEFDVRRKQYFLIDSLEIRKENKPFWSTYHFFPVDVIVNNEKF